MCSGHSVRMLVVMGMFGLMFMGVLMRMTMGMLMRMPRDSMLMMMFVFLPTLPILLPRQVFFPININIHLGGRDPAAHHPRDFQPRAHLQSRNRLLQQSRRNSSIHQRAQKHVAADAGKTFKVGNAH